MPRVVYTGSEREFEGDTEVSDPTVGAGVTKISLRAFSGCTGLTNLSFLKDSAVMTVESDAFRKTGVISLESIENVRKMGSGVFYGCADLRSIEGLSCEEMGTFCFAFCTSLQSMRRWPASMTLIRAGTFHECTGMTTVGCDLSHVTEIGARAFYGCTSLLPPSLSDYYADPAEVLVYLKRKSKDERVAARSAFLCSLKHGHSNYYNRTGDQCGASRRIIMEFAGLFPA